LVGLDIVVENFRSNAMSDLVVERIEDQSDFDRVVGNMKGRLKSIGNIDYQYYKQELQQLQQPLSEIFNPESLAKDLAQVQAFKDRAVEIVAVLTENYLLHKQVIDILTKGWPRMSNEKSAEKREGEALLKMSNFIMEANAADIAYRYAMLIMRNLESQMDNVSRQITCAQAAAQINGGRYAFDTDGMHGGEGNAIPNRDNEEDDEPTYPERQPAYAKFVNPPKKDFENQSLNFESFEDFE
jgi:hypothetical protein